MNVIQDLLSRARRDSNLEDLLRHSGVLYVGGVVSALLTIAQQLTTARSLGSANYGLLATVVGTSALVMLIFDVRTWEVGTKLLVRPILDKAYHEAARVVTWLLLTDLTLGALTASLLFLSAQSVATHLLKSSDLDALVRLYTVSIPFRFLSLGIAGAVLRIFDRFDWLAIKSVVYALLRLILMSGPALLNLGLAAVMIGAIIGEILNALALIVMAWAIMRREMPGTRLFDLAKPQSFVEGRRLMGQLWIGATLKGLQLETFIPLLALLTSPMQVGLFRVGMDITDVITKLVTPVSVVVSPSVIKVYEQETRPGFLRYIKQIFLVLAALTAPAVVGIVAFGPWAFPRLLGEDYTGIAGVVDLLAVGYGINAVALWIRPALVALGRIHEQNMIGLIVLLISSVTLIVLAPIHGAVGGAIAMSGFFGIYAGLSFLIFQRGLQ
jgi:O-antigen/teichoic acid export membrane protein